MVLNLIASTLIFDCLIPNKDPNNPHHQESHQNPHSLRGNHNLLFPVRSPNFAATAIVKSYNN